MSTLQQLVRRFSGGGQSASVRDAYPVWQGADYDSVSLVASTPSQLVIRRITVHGLAEIEEREPTTEELAHLTAWIEARLPERSWWKIEVFRLASLEVRNKLRADRDMVDLFLATTEPVSESRVIAFLQQAVDKGVLTQGEVDGLMSDLRRAFDGD